MTEFDQLQEEEAKRVEREFYEGLDDNIMALRTEVWAQAKLLKELGMVPQFIDRVLELERLQKAWDAIEE